MAENDPRDRSELASFGEELRREREIRGISLKEIADATKISKRFLESIERNDHAALPAPVFTRGFVREYARYLGLNAEEIVNRYNYAAAGDDRVEKSIHLDRVAQMPVHPNETRREPKRGIPPAYARVDRNIWFLLLIVALLGGFTWFALKHRRDMRNDGDVTAHAVAAPKRVAKAAPPVVVAPPPLPELDGNLHLTMELTAPSWITLDVDGKTVLNDELRRGDRRTFEALNAFRFRTIGNAAGVRLTLNGVEMPRLGSDGSVLHDHVLDHSSIPAAAATAAAPARSTT